MNLYQAFGGNSVNYTDPWGENIPEAYKTGYSVDGHLVSHAKPRYTPAANPWITVQRYELIYPGYGEQTAKALAKLNSEVRKYNNQAAEGRKAAARFIAEEFTPYGAYVDG